MQPMRTTEHNYLTVGGRRWCMGCNTYQVFKGGRRWCMGCNTYQVFKGGRWRDGYPPAPWPGYEATQDKLPKGEEGWPLVLTFDTKADREAFSKWLRHS